MADLVIIPFHDWRKVQREGGRTRDAHLIQALSHNPAVRRIVIINRPVTLAEMIYRRSNWKTRGDVTAKASTSELTRVGEKMFVVDNLELALIAPSKAGKQWFFSSYGSDHVVSEVEDYLEVLNVQDFQCISFSVYAHELFARLQASLRLFDAWDNFLKFPSNAPLLPTLTQAYRNYSVVADAWTTNSFENQKFYRDRFGVSSTVIRNGVDPAWFIQSRTMPEDLETIPRPIAMMGMKVTHLLDTELLNKLTAEHPDVHFVLIGQVLDKESYAKIQKRRNFHYLGDKHYNEYPAYVEHADVCVIPYHIDNRQHGGDAIKFYEYLAAGKPVVGTNGNGVDTKFDGVWACNSTEDMSSALHAALQIGRVERELPEEITWAHKSNQLLSALTRESETTCTAPQTP